MSDNRTPLDDFEAADLLHRMVWDLSRVRGETTRGDTALKASRAVLLLYLAALVSEPQHEPEHRPSEIDVGAPIPYRQRPLRRDGHRRAPLLRHPLTLAGVDFFIVAVPCEFFGVLLTIMIDGVAASHPSSQPGPSAHRRRVLLRTASLSLQQAETRC